MDSKIRSNHLILASNDAKGDQQQTARGGAGSLKTDTYDTPQAKRIYSPGNVNYTFKEREKAQQASDINQLIAEYERELKPPAAPRPPKGGLLSNVLSRGKQPYNSSAKYLQTEDTQPAKTDSSFYSKASNTSQHHLITSKEDDGFDNLKLTRKTESRKRKKKKRNESSTNRRRKANQAFL